MVTLHLLTGEETAFTLDALDVAEALADHLFTLEAVNWCEVRDTRTGEITHEWGDSFHYRN